MKKTKSLHNIIEKEDVKRMSELSDERFEEEVKYQKNRLIRRSKRERKMYILEEKLNLENKWKLNEYEKNQWLCLSRMI